MKAELSIPGTTYPALNFMGLKQSTYFDPKKYSSILYFDHENVEKQNTLANLQKLSVLP